MSCEGNTRDMPLRQPRIMNSVFRAGPILLLALALTGCATTTDCSGGWYSHGWRDGRYGTFAQAELYARRCPAVDVGEYNRGWRDGVNERPTLGGM